MLVYVNLNKLKCFSYYVFIEVDKNKTIIKTRTILFKTNSLFSIKQGSCSFMYHRIVFRLKNYVCVEIVYTRFLSSVISRAVMQWV